VRRLPVALDDLKKHLKFVKNGHGNQEARFICPFCPQRGMGEDRRGHLYINLAKGTYFCHRCNASGNIHSLNLQLGTNIQLSELSHQAQNNLDFLAKKITSVKIKDIKKEFRPLYPLVSEQNSNREAQEAIDYLLSRNLTPAHIKSYSWGLIKQYPNYVFVPLIMNEELRGWQGRYYKVSTGKKVMKYFTIPGGIGLHEILFNYDNARFFKKTIITEGVFDAIAGGLNTMATFGKTLSNCQKKILATNKFREIIFAYDKDAQKESQKLANQMKLYAEKTGYVEWFDELGFKDLGEIHQYYGKEGIKAFLEESVIYV
jgi:DNA primase